MKAAILGFGNVGSGAWEIANEYGCGIEIKRILARRMRPGMEGVITTDFNDILNDPQIELVAEAIGGLHPAYEYAVASLKAKKHFVSANKQLISHYYSELTQLAAQNSVQLRFAPSSGGGIPWLPNLLRAKRCDEIIEISGILNGTTNYILYNMAEHDLPFADVLRDAQSKGYAEADPAADIDGTDAMRKCAISASLAFDAAVDENSVDVFGIRRITEGDVAAFKKMGRVCKLLVSAARQNGVISAYVEPTLLLPSAIESLVPSNFNMTTLVAKRVGRLSFFGQGAGKYPTGSSMVQDMIDIAQSCGSGLGARTPVKADNAAALHRYYVRTSASSARLAEVASNEGGYFITKPVSVAFMHRLAAELCQSDPAAFFAGFADR